MDWLQERAMQALVRVPRVSAALLRLCSAPARALRLPSSNETPRCGAESIRVIRATFSSSVAHNAAASVPAAPRPRVARKAALIVTEAAAARLKHLMQAQENAIGIKIGVRQRGCNGYT